jgi:protein involved in polysaccharide export with SLBB domain
MRSTRILLVGLLLLGARPVEAQFEKTETSPLDIPKRKGRAKNVPTQVERKTAAQVNVLETVIDPDAYVVGPGDEFLITIWGQLSESVTTLISPEGMIVVPSVREFDVRNLTLSQMKEKLKTGMASVYTGADVSVNLLSVRSFKVNVTGLVVNGGSVIVSAVDRASEVILQAGGFDTTYLSEQVTPSRRNIQIRRRNGTILRADLDMRDNAGDVALDPLLVEGDVVFVPPVFARFYVFGAVRVPGPYEYVSGERLTDVVRLCGGFAHGIDSSEAELVRFTGDTATQHIRLDLKAALARPTDTTANLRIQPDDRIYFRKPSRFHEVKNVRITGAVSRPGVYAITEGLTTFSDIVVEAGGFTPEVSLDNIVVFRGKELEDEVDFEYNRLSETSILEMNEIEKSYFKARTRQYYPIVQTDFSRLFANGKVNKELDVLLRNGDVIEVGKQKRTVKVVGAVAAPGLVELSPGQNYRYYIWKSGGYSGSAMTGSVRIIKPTSQTWVDAKSNMVIEDGDIIFVPERDYISGWTIFKETIAVVGQIAAITATIILIAIQVK